MRAPNQRLFLARGDLAQVGWPPVTTGPSATLVALLHRLEQTQWLPADVIADRQRRQLSVVAEWFAPRSTWVADRLAAAGLGPADLARPGALETLPVLTRRELQALGPALFVDEVPARHGPVSESHSSGSTGEPVVVRRTGVTRLFYGALAIRDYLWRDLDLGGGFASVRGNVDEPRLAPTWGWPMEPLFATGPCQVTPTATPIDEVFERLAAFRPTVLLSYPTVIAALCELAARREEPLASITWVQAIGETVAPDLERRVADAFGARFWEVYSSEELGYIAARCPDGPGSHVMAESVLVEVIDDRGKAVAPGGEGRVVVTDLHNLATPLLRYDLGDRAVVGPPCACGRGLPVVDRVLGHERNLVVLPDGSRHWPRVGPALEMIRHVAPVEQMQLVQSEQDLIEAYLVVSSPLDRQQEDGVIAGVHEAVGHPFPVRLVYVEGRLPAGPRGKHEEFRCEIGAASHP